MGLANVNVWVSQMDNPCGVDSRTWYVNFFDCDGKILEWCGKRFIVLPAKCGHLRIAVPPGCYRINAVWSFRVVGGTYYVNHFTDSSIVQARCCEEACVKLFNPSIHRCGTIFVRAIRDLLAQNAVDQNVAKQAIEAVEKITGIAPVPNKPFELAYLDEMEALVRQQEALDDAALAAADSASDKGCAEP